MHEAIDLTLTEEEQAAICPWCGQACDWDPATERFCGRRFLELAQTVAEEAEVV